MRTLVDEGVDDDASASAETRRPAPLPSLPVALAVGAATTLGIVARFVQRSPLWLDEALSVNIARLPVGDLLEALRHDGHPPFYYLLLHYWMELVGEGDVAVRALSGIFAVASLPLAWVAGRRLAGAGGARWALVVVALSPYWVRYATETRMYSLAMLLVLGGYLLLVDALDRPAWPRLAGLALVSGLLLLTHYWAFYLLAAAGLVLAARAWRRPGHRGSTLRVLAALAAGGVLFLPWLGGFLYQAANTGTPWGEPFRPTAIVEAIVSDMGGGTVSEASLYGTAVVLLALLALFAARSSGHEIELDLRTTPTVRHELATVGLVVAIGGAVSLATSATFQSRYAAVVVPLLLLAVAVGIVRVPGRARLVVGAVYLGLSIAGIAWVNYYQRTQADEVAAAVAARARPGDVVVYCPDQLGPGYSRAMPEGLVELTYPRLASPERVDWVDYAETNAAADPGELAEDIRARAGDHAVFAVWMSEYRTFGQQCEQLIGTLGLTENLVVQDDGRFYEPASLHWAPAEG
ncbi:MAG: glycosyltransferase family 39 protein [Acidimicrobiales bacterium]